MGACFKLSSKIFNATFSLTHYTLEHSESESQALLVRHRCLLTKKKAKKKAFNPTNDSVFDPVIDDIVTVGAIKWCRMVLLLLLLLLFAQK